MMESLALFRTLFGCTPAYTITKMLVKKQ